MFVGGLTFAAGVVLILRHVHVWRIKTDLAENDMEKRFLRLQVRRRALTSAMIAVLGLVLCGFYWSSDWFSFTALVASALILIPMILLMASLDMLMTGQSLRPQRASKSSAAKEMVREYERLKKKAAEKRKQDDPE